MDWLPGDRLDTPRWEGWGRPVGIAVLLSALIWFGLYSLAFAQQGRLSNCSQTVTTGSAAVPFPASGATGPPAPTGYLEICNAHASNTLGVNAYGGTAAIGAEGTLTLNPGGCVWFSQGVIPVGVTVIGSASSTTTACWYR